MLFFATVSESGSHLKTSTESRLSPVGVSAGAGFTLFRYDSAEAAGD